MTKPGAGTVDIFAPINLNYKHLTKRDVIVVQGGSNDVYRNNSMLALTQFVKFCEDLNHVNIIILDIPRRYDLIETSCINKEIQIFNRKLRKIIKAYNHVTVLEVNNNREAFTRHGMHLNKAGKGQTARQIANEIRRLTVDKVSNIISLDWKQASEPVSLYWITEQADKSNQAPRDEMLKLQEDLKEVAVDGEVTAPSAATCEESASEMEGRSDDSTQPGSLENLENMENSLTKVVRASRRLKRSPSTKSNDFLW
jgi:hypothetical protein